jgi:hypothetical protein
MLAPKPYLTACLHVLEQALLDCRAGLRTGKMTGRQAEALMDAVHSIPSLMERWEECDLDQLRAELSGYDAEWPGGHLLRVFEISTAPPSDLTE